MLPLLAPLMDDIDINEGIFAPFELTLPPGTVVNAQFPAATSLGSASTWHTIAHAVHQAIRQGCDTFVAGPRLDGAGPRVLLFAPIGTVEESIPIYLDPGFTIAADGWGPTALQGARRLVSAEEMEARDRLRLMRRELVEGHGMRVRVVNLRGALEANFFVPPAAQASHGSIRVIMSKKTHEPTVATAFVLDEHAEIELDYPLMQETA